MNIIMRRLAFRLTSVCVIATMVLYAQAGSVTGMGRKQVPTALTPTPPQPLPHASTTSYARSSASSTLPICQAMGDSLGLGVSIFSAAGTWIVETHTEQGVDWRFGYFYTGHREHPLNADSIWFLNRRLTQIEEGGAIPVVTFYAMLEIGMEKFSGSEAQIVQQMLQDPASMRDYFDNFIDLLKLLDTRTAADDPIIMQVEPDSWGFMMWAMGVEGNSDATSVPVKVAASGHPDVQGFADHAGGLGQVLVHLRDQYAPHVLLGWHASNNRVGTRPDVVVGFFGSMGEWDVLFSDQPHMLPEDAPWWQTWDSTLVNTNLNWYRTISSATHLPFLIWQDTLGNDYHLIGNWPADKTMLTQLASAGVAGYMFEHLNHCNDAEPDDFRGRRRCTPAPGGQPSGRAKDYRDRVLAYQIAPLTWPVGSPCRPATSFQLRVLRAETAASTLTVTLQWIPPSDAVTQTLRYAHSFVTEDNWATADVLSDTLAGSISTYTATMSYTDGLTYYFALKAQDSQGAWSALSNNAFWPYYDTYLPLVRR
jgi:hypothetical protein